MKRHLSSFSFIALFLISNMAFAYIMPSDSVLFYMTQSRGDYSGLEMTQNISYYDARFPDGKKDGVEKGWVSNKGNFLFKGEFDKVKPTWIKKGKQFIFLVNGQRAKSGQWANAPVIDIFTYKDPQQLRFVLERMGIDLNQISYNRDGNDLVYVIGSESNDSNQPQLWVHKQTFAPFKLQFKKDGQNVEYRFDQYGRNTPSWYPGRIELFVDDILISSIRAQRVYPKKEHLADSLFDLSKATTKFPESKGYQSNVSLKNSHFDETLEYLRETM